MCKAQELLEAMKKLLGENYYNIILVMMDCVNNWMQEDKVKNMKWLCNLKNIFDMFKISM